MAPSDSGQELFDEAQVGRILQRTAELQARHRGKAATGLSLGELQELATETGLDPLLVSAAVAELRSEAATRDSTWWGGPIEFNLEHTFRGSVDTPAWERMIEVIRRTFGQEGDIEERGSTREWIRTVKDGNGGRVSMREHEGDTTIYIYWRVAMPAVLLYILNGVLALLTLPVLFEEFALGLFPGLPVWIAFVGSIFLLVRWLVNRNASKEKHRATTLMSELVAMATEDAMAAGVEREGHRHTERGAAPETGRRLVLDEPDPEESAEDDREAERSLRRDR